VAFGTWTSYLCVSVLDRTLSLFSVLCLLTGFMSHSDQLAVLCHSFKCSLETLYLLRCFYVRWKPVCVRAGCQCAVLTCWATWILTKWRFMPGAPVARPAESSFHLAYHITHAKEFNSTNKVVICCPSYLSEISSHLSVCMLNLKSRSASLVDKFNRISSI